MDLPADITEYTEYSTTLTHTSYMKKVKYTMLKKR